jgi:hypothetical protein
MVQGRDDVLTDTGHRTAVQYRLTDLENRRDLIAAECRSRGTDAVAPVVIPRDARRSVRCVLMRLRWRIAWLQPGAVQARPPALVFVVTLRSST